MDPSIITELLSNGGALAIIAAMWFYSQKLNQDAQNRSLEMQQKLADNQAEIIKNSAINSELLRQLIKGDNNV